MIHTTPTKGLWTTTCQPLVGPRSGALARGARLRNPLRQEAPTPQKIAALAAALRHVGGEVGRRMMAWVLPPMASEHPVEAPARMCWPGRVSRRRAQPRGTVAPRFGPVDVWRRLDAPWDRGGPSLHPLEHQGRAGSRARTTRVSGPQRPVGGRSSPTARPGAVGERPCGPLVTGPALRTGRARVRAGRATSRRSHQCCPGGSRPGPPPGALGPRGRWGATASVSPARRGYGRREPRRRCPSWLVGGTGAGPGRWGTGLHRVR